MINGFNMFLIPIVAVLLAAESFQNDSATVININDKVKGLSTEVEPLKNNNSREVIVESQKPVSKSSNGFVESQHNLPFIDYLKSYDATNILKAHVDSLKNESLGIEEMYMSPLYMPLVFNSIPRHFRIKRMAKPVMFKGLIPLDTCETLKRFDAESYVLKLSRGILLQAEVDRIGFIRYTQENLPEPEKVVYQLDGRKSVIRLGRGYKLPENSVDKMDLPHAKFNPWSRRGNAQLQFSQTYISPNWSKGGESNMTGMTSLYLSANYNNLRNLQFENNLEIKAGLNTVSSDTLRNLNVSTDQVRAVSKVGLKMYNDWFYSLSAEFLTQMLNNYKKNTMTMTASLLSPAKLFISLGIDYKKSDPKKGYDLSVMLSPLTYKMNYLYDINNFDPASYGVDKGRHFGNEIGSKISSDLNWTFNNRMNLKSKFNYYTDFTYVDSEWENTVNFNISNNISMQFYLHLIADDRIDRDKGEPLIQVQELTSFGLVYRW